MSESLRMAIGSDHAAYARKEALKAMLEAAGHVVEDFGTHSEESVDYPAIGRAVAEAVAEGRADRGMLLCGTGLGMSYVANRFAGVRAALCWSCEAARLAREHNDSNLIVLPGRVATIDPLEEILAAWMETPFSGDERHQRRIRMIEPGTA